MRKVLILRYGEINLKGKNRQYFEKALKSSLKKKLEPYTEAYKISFLRNRIFLEVKDNLDFFVEQITFLPGIENFSVADVTTSDYQSIKNLAIFLFDKNRPNFKVKTKRSYKQFKYNSQEVSKLIGGEILKENNGLADLKVSMKNYDQMIGIEIQQDKSYIYNEIKRGMGGLPIGSSGKGLVFLSGGIDSPISAIETLKRGMMVDCIHFHTPPYTNKDSLNKVHDLVKQLKVIDPRINLYVVNITNLQKEIKEKCNDKYSLILMRRMMFRIATNYLQISAHQAIITGESLGQVASQTIESLSRTNEVSLFPILRPLITFNKNQIIDLAKRYNTYDISILPFSDACDVFAPDKPVIMPKKDDVLKEEKKIDYKSFIDQIKIEKYMSEDESINDYL